MTVFARCGLVRCGKARPGAAWPGAAWRGTAWQGEAGSGVARLGEARCGEVRPGRAWRGKAWHGCLDEQEREEYTLVMTRSELVAQCRHTAPYVDTLSDHAAVCTLCGTILTYHGNVVIAKLTVAPMPLPTDLPQNPTSLPSLDRWDSIEQLAN